MQAALLSSIALLGSTFADVAIAQIKPPTKPAPQAAPTPTEAAAPFVISSTAEAVYARAKPRILQIRTLLESAGRQSSIGSGFLVSDDGLAVTNYHVVSQYALEPKTYRLEYAAPDGSKGGMKLLAIDVVNDLAVVKINTTGMPHFEFDQRALKDQLPKGERIYAMGNPLDLGFTIVEGTYNGLVDKSYDERIHFSGAINPGMSGGPVTGADGRIVGVNVAKRLDGEQVGFLVPAKFAAALLERARKDQPLDVAKARDEVGRQLNSWQGAFYKQLSEQGFRNANYGPYRGLESAARWVNCWAGTNANQMPKPRYVVNNTTCDSQTGLFISSSLYTGRVQLVYSYYRSTDQNPFQFARQLSLSGRLGGYGFRGGKRLTEQECHDDFVEVKDAKHPVLRATWCARAYREFEGIYDVTVMAVTQDRSNEALAAQLSMQGVAYNNALALGKRFLEAIQWAQ
jgi:serine protease Do